nr:hypothetical protein CFP56_70022 [Quercus suber]
MDTFPWYVAMSLALDRLTTKFHGSRGFLHTLGGRPSGISLARRAWSHSDSRSNRGEDGTCVPWANVSGVVEAGLISFSSSGGDNVAAAAGSVYNRAAPEDDAAHTCFPA